MSEEKMDLNTEERRDKINLAVETYFDTVVLSVCKNFFLGLIEQRGELNFYTVNMKNIKDRVISPPYFNEVMAEYVLTEILPLAAVLNQKRISQQSIETLYDGEQVTRIQEMFSEATGLRKAFLGVWPKLHHLRFDRTTKRGKTVSDIYLMSKPAAEKIHTAKLLLSSHLHSILKGNISEGAIEDQIIALSQNNTLNIAGQGLSDTKDKLLHSLMWVVSAFTDWLQVEAVFPADIIASVRMIAPFEGVDVLSLVVPIRPKDDVDEKEQSYLQALEDRIYNIFIQQDLYPSEQTLYMTLGFLVNVSNDEVLTERIIRFGEYLT